MQMHTLVDAGQLDRRVQLQAPTVTRGSTFGDEAISYSTSATLWARVAEALAPESTQAEQRVASRKIAVRIRYRSDVLPTWRVVFGSRVWRIDGLAEVGRRQFLDIACTETSDA